MSSRKLTERFAYEGGQVDRTGPRPVVRGVLLCGATSANRRRYSKEAFAGDRVKKYDGRPVFVGHSDGKAGRVYGEQLGWIRNPRLRADGMPVGDIEVKPKHPLAEQFLDDAQNDPRAVGMSHVAHCKTATARDGWEEVGAVESVESVDVVLDPATTTSLFESTGRPTVGLTVRKLVEALVRHPKVPAARVAPLKLLGEMDGMDAAATGLDAAPPEDADPADGVKEAFKTAVMHIVDQAMSGGLDPKEALGKIKELLASHGKVNGKGDGGAAPEAEEPAPESRQKAPDRFAIVEELQNEFGPDYAPGLALMEALVLLPTAAARKALAIETRGRQTGAQPPRSGGRYQPLAETAARQEEAVAADAKTFLARVME